MSLASFATTPAAEPAPSHKQSIGFLLNDAPNALTTSTAPFSSFASHSAAAEKQKRRRPSGVQCDVCSRTFSEASAARKHMRVVHLKLKAYSCGICRRRFAERSNLKKHIIALHQRDRSHPCPTCGKTFSFSDGLRRHVNNRHLGLRPHSCDRCPATFKQRTHLQKHQTSVHALDPAEVAAGRGPGRRSRF